MRQGSGPRDRARVRVDLRSTGRPRVCAERSARGITDGGELLIAVAFGCRYNTTMAVAFGCVGFDLAVIPNVK